MKKFAIIALFFASCGPSVGDGECENIVCDPVCTCSPAYYKPDEFSVGNVWPGEKIHFYRCDCDKDLDRALSRIVLSNGFPVPSRPDLDECFAIVRGSVRQEGCFVEVNDTCAPCVDHYINLGGPVACSDI